MPILFWLLGFVFCFCLAIDFGQASVRELFAAWQSLLGHLPFEGEYWDNGRLDWLFLTGLMLFGLVLTGLPTLGALFCFRRLQTMFEDWLEQPVGGGMVRSDTELLLLELLIEYQPVTASGLIEASGGRLHKGNIFVHMLPLIQQGAVEVNSFGSPYRYVRPGYYQRKPDTGLRCSELRHLHPVRG